MQDLWLSYKRGKIDTVQYLGSKWDIMFTLIKENSK